MRFIRPATLAAWLVLFTPLLAFAQHTPSTWTLTGRVVDSTGAAVPRATIVVSNAATGFERVLASDVEGRFEIGGLAGAAYRVTAGLAGFDTAAVEVTRDMRITSLTLRPARHVEETTVVSGSRVEERRASLNTRVDVISRARLDSAPRSSVGEALREIPGVVSRRGSEGTVAAGQQIQGLDSRQVAVLVDGQPVAGARGVKSGVITLDRPATEHLDRIEVVKGAASALFGSDAMGGVINMITRRPDRPLELNASASAGGFGVRDAGASGGGSRSRLSFYGAAGRHERDSFDLSPATPDTSGAALARTTLFAKVLTRPFASLQLQATGSGYRNSQRGRFLGEGGLQDSDVRDRAASAHVSADWTPSWRSSVQWRVYGSRFREDSINQPLSGGASEIGLLREGLLKTDVTVGYVVGERQHLQAGAEWTRDRYDGINRLRDDAAHHALTSVIWVQDRINIVERATVTIGVRYDDHSVFGSELSPKVGANVRAFDNLHIRASYGEGFRAPDLGQLYYRFVPTANVYQVIGNPRLSPETNRSWQVGADYRTWQGRARVGINAFRNDAFDLINAESLGFLRTPAQLQQLVQSGRVDASFSPVFGRLLLVYRNLAEVRTQGVELDGEAALRGGFSLAASYTYLDAIDRGNGGALTGRHRHHGFARLTWAPSSSPLRAELRGALYGSWLATATERAPSFALWDAIAAYRLRGGSELFVAVDNAFNSQDPATGTDGPIYRPEVGRAWRAGLRFSWSGR